MTGLSDELNRLNTEGWSTRDIERIARRHGHKLHNSTVSNYLRGRHGTPSAAVLEGFAAVFGVDVNGLRAAAGLPGLAEPFVLTPDASRLTEPQRDAVRRVVQQFIEANDAVPDRPVRDGATIHRLSPQRPRLLGPDDEDDILEEPYAADTSEDPGEDDQ